jgi:hypothetical protein
MWKDWSVDELILKLPLITVTLKAPSQNSNAPSKPAESIAALAGMHGLKISIRAFNDLFVSADLNTNGELMANRPKVDTWEVFELFRLQDSKVALRACNGKFVGAKIDEHKQLIADRASREGWEAFTLMLAG